MSSNPLRIAICPPDLDPMQNAMNGGPADATYIIQMYIANGLLSRGHNLTFVAPYDLNQVVSTNDLQKPRVAAQTWSASRWYTLASRGAWRLQSWLGLPYLNFFSNYSRLDAYLNCLPVHDVVYERNGLYNVGVAMACQRLNLPYVLFVEADEILEHDYMGKPLTGLMRWRANRIFRTNLQAADCIICVSEASKNHLATNWSIQPEKIVVFPNGVNVQRFRPNQSARSKIRATLGLDTNMMILFVGSFYDWHDVTTLLESFVDVLKSYPDAQLVLVGNGKTRQTMIHRAADLSLGGAVQFVGNVDHDEVPHFMNAADIAVAPYPVMEHDLWLSPLKLFEYMASGTAVIASAVGQIANVIEDSRNGLLVAPGDIQAMTAALQRLINDPPLRAHLGQQAREDMERDHSWDQYLSRLERLFVAVIDGQTFSQI